ncbi:hypothetical protein VFPPC_13682 [Pochonia chlamydosporia 170]|uniref:Uncharacterized protein n=1 Tax=Pochonia chlamydosporia 170 TaxID=1380566 RepID=A0A179FSW2_METCM|nr:hypothetical protein VFPPC_13682 [Pochonia chlamydosporia 170]OAQ68447.1 hypothetical protein VFPPC_13682 [Pochonia chlamydosporia 170]
MPTRVNGSPKPRFELPALDLNFGSITDGTNIPPPPDSPKVPTPPQTPPAKKLDAAVVNGSETDKSTPPTTNGNIIAGIKRPADDAPLSPAGSARQGSLRRLFSRNMLNASYTEGNLNSLESGSLVNSSRPPSRGASSLMAGRKSRRNSWFKLFRGGESKRSSILFDDITSPRKPSGPPPPMIPELKDLEKDEGSLGNDLFKNIK